MVEVLDLVLHDHRPYLVMADFGGIDLRNLLKTRSLELIQLIDISMKSAFSP